MQNKITTQENATVNTISGVIEQKEELTVISAIQQETFSGPLPPPSLLQSYEELRPGSIEQIFAMAEKEQNLRIETIHREQDQKDRVIAIAEKESEHNIKMQSLGLRIGSIVLLACVICAAIGAFLGWYWEVIGLFLSAPLLAVIRSLVGRDRTTRRIKLDT